MRSRVIFLMLSSNASNCFSTLSNSLSADVVTFGFFGHVFLSVWYTFIKLPETNVTLFVLPLVLITPEFTSPMASI